MKKLYYVAALAMAALNTFTAMADTDVTALYIKNAGFDSDFNYTKEKTGNIAQEILEVKGWTKDISVNYTITGVYEFGAKCTFNTSGTIPAQGIDGSAGCLALSTGWDQSLKYYQTIELPAGTYKLQSAFYNGSKQTAGTSLIGWIPNSGSASMSSINSFPLNKWTEDEIEFTLTATTKGNIQIGYLAAAGPSSNSAMIVLDYVRLILVGDQNILATGLAQRISDAEKMLESAMQPKFKTSLEEAIVEAKAISADASDETISAAIEAIDAVIDAARDNITAVAALKIITSKAKTYTTKTMAQAYLNSLLEAYNEAMAIVNLESDADVNEATTKLTKAYDEAVASYTSYTNLNKALRTATSLTKTDKEGVEDFEAAIAAAQAVLDKADATPEEMDAAKEVLETATLRFRVINSTGKDTTAKTLGVVSGATIIFARGQFPTTNKETGFCYATHPDPTFFDNYTTAKYSNNGDIYYIENLNPATVYYVRAFTLSTTYKVGYGDVVKVVTQPMGTNSFSYGYEGDDATNQRIYAACEEGVWMWNNVSGIQKFHLSAHYKPGAGAGDGTAECSYGGYMSVSQNTGCQKTGTILHEGAHGLGMVPYTDWTNSIYRANGDRGDWQGARVDRIIRFLENSTTAKLHGDNQHMWPYGINGAGEDTGSRMLYFANALLVGALAEDGIRTPNQDFLKPAYSFSQDDETKYYIKCVDETRGLATSYLREGKANQLKWTSMTADEAFSNDSCAWYVTFVPAKALYIITNAATGKRINFSSGFRMANSTATTTQLQLLPTRVATKSGNYTFSANAYWIVSTSHTSLNALDNSNVGSANFDHANTATTQQWLILTANEVTSFAEANGETVGIRDIDNFRQDTTGGLAISSERGQLSITATNTGVPVSIYTVDGRIVHRAYVAADAKATISLPRGLYIVNGKKVTVR